LGRDFHLYLTSVISFWTQLQEMEKSHEHDLALGLLMSQETRVTGKKKKYPETQQTRK